MSALKSANVTKYDAGGSGDDYIADGLIKTVEKVWQDSYAGLAAIPSLDTIDIAVVPDNKKITSVDLYFAAAISGSAATGTGATMTIGTRNAAGTTASTMLLDAGECLTATKSLSADEVDTIMTNLGTGGPHVVFVMIGRLATTVTGSAALPLIRSIVRWT